MKNPEIDSGSFDAFMATREIGPLDLSKLRVGEDIHDLVSLLHDSSMIAATKVGVVVGSGATEYATEKAMKAGFDQDVFEPLWDRAPHPIETRGTLDFIPRKIGETRGIYFARVLAAIEVREEDDESSSNLAFGLATQLLLDQKQTEIRGKNYTIVSVRDNDSIAQEIATLQRIAESAEKYTDLNKDEIEELHYLIELAEDRHEDLKELAAQTNVELVEELIELRKENYQPKRIRNKLGALACGAFCVGAVLVMPQLDGRSDISKESRQAARKEIDKLKSVVTFVDSSPMNKEVFDSAKKIIDQVETEAEAKILNQTLKKEEYKMFRGVLEQVDDADVYLKTKSDVLVEDRSAVKLNKALDNFKNTIPSASDGLTQLLFMYGLLGIEVAFFAGAGLRLGLNSSKYGGKRDLVATELLPRVLEGEIPSVELLAEMKKLGFDYIEEYGLLLRPKSPIVQSYNDTNAEIELKRRRQQRQKSSN